jgi:PilZ domain
LPGFGKVRIEVLGRRLPLEVRGTITNITQGEIHVRLDEFLRGGPVRVWFSDDCHSDGQLLFCRVVEGAYKIGINFPPDPQQHRRAELRVPLRNQTAVVCQLESSRDDKWSAQATDISRSGLGLLVEHRLAVNTIVKVELSFAIVFGEVLYSKPALDGGYRVGLRIETLLMRDGRMGLDAEILDRPFVL